MSFGKHIVKLGNWWDGLRASDREEAKKKIIATIIITVFVLAFTIPGPRFILVSAIIVLSGFWFALYLDISELKPTAYRSKIRRMIFDKE